MGTVTTNRNSGSAPAPRNGDAASAPVSYTDRKQVLSALAAGKLTEEQADALLSSFENNRAATGITWRVSKSGGVSVYGLQRMPVTLYLEQWGRLAEKIPELMAWIKANEGKTFVIDEKDDMGKATGRKLNVAMKRKGQ